MNSPTVSVVIPTHGRPQYLQRAVESVFAQTLRPIEIVIVDDNWDDEKARQTTFEIAERVPAEGGGAGHNGSASALDIQVLTGTTGKSLGGAAARNLGVARSQGELIAFLDDDDWWEPTKLEEQIRTFSISGNTTLGLVYTGRRIVDERGRTKHLRRASAEGAIAETLIGENVIGTTSCGLVPRKVFEEIGGFDESLPARQDLDLWYRIACRYPVAAVSEALTVQQEHLAGRISRQFDSRLRGMELFFEKHYEAISKHPALLAAHYTQLAQHHLKHGHPLSGRILFWKAFRASPSLRAFFRVLKGIKIERSTTAVSKSEGPEKHLTQKRSQRR